jgi:predicted DNA-binding transcriptional regulator AlpA
VKPESEHPLASLREFAEVVADVLVERGLVMAVRPDQPSRVLSANEVAGLLGRDRHWVYAHADELGAFRFGDGPRARLGFDRARVEEWKRRRQAVQVVPPKLDRRRRGPVRADSDGGELIPFEPTREGPHRRQADESRRRQA